MQLTKRCASCCAMCRFCCVRFITTTNDGTPIRPIDFLRVTCTFPDTRTQAYQNAYIQGFTLNTMRYRRNYLYHMFLHCFRPHPEIYSLPLTASQLPHVKLRQKHGKKRLKCLL